MKTAFRIIMFTAIFVIPTITQAATLTLGPSMGEWELAPGYNYVAIEAAVAPGQSHGAPFVLGRPVGSLREFGLVVSSETNGTMTFGSYLPAMSLWSHESGNDPSPFTVVNDLRHLPDGSPLLIGGSSSPRASTNGEEATIWEMNTTNAGLVPKSLGFIGNNTGSISILGGGNAEDGYVGSNSAGPTYVPPIGGGQLLDAGGVFLPGLALDLDDRTAVGAVDFHAAFWSRGDNGNWSFGTVQLPEWSDGTGEISDVVSGLMGGYLYKPDVDDVVPVLWNTDGTINKVFDLVGYNVTEMIVDHGAVVTLLNQGTFGQHSAPSLLFSDNWNGPRSYYGDIVPSLPDGEFGYVEDISSGGSLYVLAQNTSSGHPAFAVTQISASVPEPTSLIMASFGLAGLLLGRRVRE